MYLTSIKLRNFLSFGDNEQEILFDKLNTIVGSNDAGKTNIFRAISFMSDTLKNNTVNPDPYYHNGDLTKFFDIQINIKLNDEELEALSNFIICSTMSDPVGQSRELDQGRMMNLVGDFIVKNAKKIAHELFSDILVIIRKKENRSIYRGDHIIKIGNKKENLFLNNFNHIGNHPSIAAGMYRASQIFFDEIQKKNPDEINRYVTMKIARMPQVTFSEKEILNLFYNIINNEKSKKEVILSSFRFESVIRQNPNESIRLQEFVVKRGFDVSKGLTLFDMIALIFTSSIIRTSDLRSKPKAFLMPEMSSPLISIHDSTGENLPSILFQLKNSENSDLLRRYNEISKKFTEISNGLGFDVGIRSSRVVKAKTEKLVPLPNPQGYRIDNVSPAGIEQGEILEVQNELIIRFIKDDVSIPMEFAAAGRFETLLLLTVLIGQQGKVLLLDEPALNIHPILQRKILELIEGKISKSDNQIIIITHSPYLVNPENLENFWRISSTKNGSKVINIRQSISKLNNDDIKKAINQLRNSDIRSLLFSKGVVFVEGLSDKIVIEKIIKHISEKKKINSLEDLDWSIIEIGGKRSLALFIILARNLNLPYVSVMDYDALMKCERNLVIENDKIFTSEIPIGLYHAGLLTDKTVKKLKTLEKSIKPHQIVDDNKNKHKTEYWYPNTNQKFLNEIAKNARIFVFKEDLEGALQNPVKRSDSKPLKDLNAINKKIEDDEIPEEFYSMFNYVHRLAH